MAYVTGLAMRRAADLYAGAAKTDPKDAAVLADYARRNADRLSWTTPSDELLARLRILNGRDADLAADATRAANRLRDALLTVSPALERAVGDKLSSSGGARDALARWGTPTALRDAGKARVRTRIAKRSPRTAQRLTDAIWGALDAQSVTVTAEATWWTPSPSSPPTWASAKPARHNHRGRVHGPPAGKSPRQPVRVRPANRRPDPR